jgi:hypothetical protein
LETAFALLHPRRFDAVNELHDLSLQSQESAAGLAKLPVVVAEFLHGGNLFRRRGDVLRPALTAVAQHGAGVELAARTVAGGFSATAAESVHRAGQKRLPPEERLQEDRELLLEFMKLPAEGAEVVGHGIAREEGGNRYLCIIIYINPQKSRTAGKKSDQEENCRIRPERGAEEERRGSEEAAVAHDAPATAEWAFCRPRAPGGLPRHPTVPAIGHRLRLNYSEGEGQSHPSGTIHTSMRRYFRNQS